MRKTVPEHWKFPVAWMCKQDYFEVMTPLDLLTGAMI